jgi:hypothetical protein
MKRLIFGLFLVILIAGTIGCSKSEIAPATSLRSAADSGSSGKLYPAAATNAPAPMTTVAKTQAGSAAYNDVQAYSADRMIIRSGSMQLVVIDVNDALKQIVNLATTYGGFVVNSNVQENQSRLYGNISVRVLSEHFNDALVALRAMAVDVKSETTSGQDVTEEYTDLSAKLRNLQAAETQLLKLMEQAGKVTDILEVQKQLVSTRGEIEQTKGRMQYLEQSSDMSLIQVTLEQSKLAMEFNASARSVKANSEILFTPTISGGFGPYSYAWDFGDGQTSTDSNPLHAYRKAGTYSVSLKVTDDRGNTVSLKRDNYISVLAGWKAGNTAGSAWNGFVGFMHFLFNLVIWLGIFSPVWIIILVILYFTVWRKRKKVK